MKLAVLGAREIPTESVLLFKKEEESELYKGEYNGEIIAVKKVYDVGETDIFHLLHLNHPNLIQFL